MRDSAKKNLRVLPFGFCFSFSTTRPMSEPQTLGSAGAPLSDAGPKVGRAKTRRAAPSLIHAANYNTEAKGGDKQARRQIIRGRMVL